MEVPTGSDGSANRKCWKCQQEVLEVPTGSAGSANKQCSKSVVHVFLMELPTGSDGSKAQLETRHSCKKGTEERRAPKVDNSSKKAL